MKIINFHKKKTGRSIRPRRNHRILLQILLCM